MKKPVNLKFIAVAGLLLLSASFIVKHYFKTESDALDGFIKGVAIGLLLVSVIKSKKNRDQRAAKIAPETNHTL